MFSETSKMFTRLTKILNDSKPVESTLNSLPPTSINTDTMSGNTFLRSELSITLKKTRNLLKTRFHS